MLVPWDIVAVISCLAWLVAGRENEPGEEALVNLGKGKPGEEVLFPPEDAWSDAVAVKYIQKDLAKVRDAAGDYNLVKDGDITNQVKSENMAEELASFYSWRDWRKYESYRMKPRTMIWQDDKIDQKCIIESRLNEELYPKRFYEMRRNDSEVDSMVQALLKQERMVIKAAHGANSEASQLFPFCGRKPSESEIRNAVVSCMNSPGEEEENWQINMVKPGVVAEECYDSGVDLNDKLGRKPIEIKVLAAWGKVMGGTLETHPSKFWIMEDGTWYQWKTSQTDTEYWMDRQKVPLSQAAWDKVIEVLQKDWATIVKKSEKIIALTGDDELRIDWFVGGKDGPKLNEITFEGGVARYPKDLLHKFPDTLLTPYLKTRKSCEDDPSKCFTFQVPEKCHSYDHEILPEINEHPDVRKRKTKRRTILNTLFWVVLGAALLVAGYCFWRKYQPIPEARDVSMSGEGFEMGGTTTGPRDAQP